MLFSLWKEQLKKKIKKTNPALNRIANLWGVWRRNNRGYSETVPLVKINLKCYLLTDSKWKYSFIFLFWIRNLRTLVWATTSTQVVMAFSHSVSLGSCKLPLLWTLYMCNCWNKKWLLPAYIDSCLQLCSLQQCPQSISQSRKCNLSMAETVETGKARIWN